MHTFDPDYVAYLGRLHRRARWRPAPSGTWRQRWLPGVCKHPTVRCTHGDEIIARRYRRRVCLVCGRALRGRLPAVCWFTSKPHTGIAPDDPEVPG